MSALKLLWRQFSDERWPALLLAFSVAILAALTAATPRLMAALDDRQLTQALDGLSAIQGDISGSWAHTTGESGVTGQADPWEPHREALSVIRSAQPEPLRSLLAEPQFVGHVEATGTVTITPPPETGYYEARFRFYLDPDIATHTELVDGAWPAVRGEAGTTEVAVLDTVAEKLGWQVGDLIDASTSANTTLTGIFRPIDPADTRWEHIPYGRNFAEEANPDRGTALVGGLFLAPGHLGGTFSATQRGPGVREPITIEAWFGVNTTHLADVDVRGLRNQVTGLLAQRYPNLPAADPENDVGLIPVEFRLESELGPRLTTVAAQQDTTRAVVAVAAVGPLAVAIALVVLAGQLVIERRRATLELVTARGLSRHQLRRMLTGEGLLLGIPAALLGHLIGTLLTPGAHGLIPWLIALVIGAVPALALAWAAQQVGPVRTRADLALRPGRARVIAEAVVGILTAAAVWALLSRDGAPAEGLDLLATATPVLITIAACLLALRLYPLPLRFLSGLRRGGRGLAAFLGSVRAHRDPAGGLTPVFTVVLGTTIAVLSAALLGSIIAGTERATWEANGSTLRISGPRISDEMRTQLEAIDGVHAVARIHDAGTNHRLNQQGEQEARVRLWLAEPALLDAYAASPFGSPLPPALFGEEAAVVLGAEVPINPGPARLEPVGDVLVLDPLASPPGIRTGAAWGVMSVERWTQDVPPATLVLVAVERGADAAEVARLAQGVVPNSLITNVADQLGAVRDTPTVSGLTSTFTALTAATAVLLALTLFGSQLMATRTRTRLGAILRTLGMGGRELRALTAWEITPGALLGLLVGTGLGVGLAALLLSALDFRSLTGGSTAPSLHLDPLLLGAVLGILIATVALTIAVTAWLAGRTNLAQELRIGEER
ncbi:MAG: FtsX-like permease family protein [Propionibacteriaceae bacterium]|nr:FtsX-like permease family protein [Propionibacteriaceae bacterium]